MSAMGDITRVQLEQAAGAVARAHGATLVVLFGSAARGGVAPGDLDIGVLAGPTLDSVAVTNELTRRLGVQAVDVSDLTRADPLLLMLVAREGVPLYEEQPGAFSRFASLAARRYADTAKFRAAERGEIADFLARVPGQ